MFTYLSSMVITASLIATIKGQEVASPPDCNVTVFGRPVFVIPVGLDWGYAGLEPNGDTFCLGKGNFDGTSFEFWLDLNLGTGCSNGNKCMDAGLRATLLAGMQTAPASMNSNALAGHLHRLVNRGDKWLIVVMAEPSNLTIFSCQNNNNYCLIEPADFPELPIKFVGAMLLADSSVQAGITTTIATLPPGVTGTAPTEPTTEKSSSALRISLLLSMFTYLTIL